jgi:predicted acylesterase/phospholipase RssA
MIGISLEAASWRGAFIAGVLRAFGERGIYPDLVSGSSSGACNGFGYVSVQLDLLTDNWIRLASQPMIDFRPRVRKANGGSFFNMSRIYRMALEHGLGPSAIDTLTNSPTELLVICTRLVDEASDSDYWNDRFLIHYPLVRHIARLAGRTIPPPPFEVEVFSSRSHHMRKYPREIFYASGRIPILYAVRANVAGQSYIDGGFLEKNPVASLLDRGCNRVLAIVSNPEGIVRESFFHGGESDLVRAERRSGRLTVIHPKQELGLSKYYWSIKRVSRAVRLGIEAGESFLAQEGDRFFGRGAAMGASPRWQPD